MSYIKGEYRNSDKKFTKKKLIKIIVEDIDKMNIGKLNYLYNYIQKIKGD